MATVSDVKRAMPKGGRKGGAVFPRIPLTDALGYARKLVSKTHTGPQAREIILSGVVGSKTGIGNVRMSALKQYQLLTGDNEKGYEASELAKKITSAPEGEREALTRQAALSPKVFKLLFDTFHGDSVSRAKLKQRAADLNVHPDELETCVGLYVSSMITATLASENGDQVAHVSAAALDSEPLLTTESEIEDDGMTDTSQSSAGDSAEKEPDLRSSSVATSRGTINVNITLDSTMDIDKLAKQLELLKKFGAI